MIIDQTTREAVLEELDTILASQHFKNSKRYPALLGYLVRKSLEGQTDHLKERTLGIEVFGRRPDYDTNADPIIRITAAEIRKKIAQFYHDRGNESRLQIDLPFGSYVPEFKRIDRAQAQLDKETPRRLPEENDTRKTVDYQEISSGSHGAVPRKLSPGRSVTLSRSHVFWISAFMVSTLCFSVYALRNKYGHPPSDDLWNPLLSSSGTVLTVLPSTLHGDAGTHSNGDSIAVANSSHGPYSRISVCDAIALSRFASLLGKRSKPFDVKEADLTNLVDLHGRSAILVGAVNNHWTMRLTEPLRFHFSEEPSSVRIVDSENPKNRNWIVDYTRPYAYATRDYALIARYKDSTTDGDILIVAGIGAHATQAASEFVVTSNGLDQIRRVAPRGWEKKNLEMIVETDIINGDAGPPHLIVTATW